MFNFDMKLRTIKTLRSQVEDLRQMFRVVINDTVRDAVQDFTRRKGVKQNDSAEQTRFGFGYNYKRKGSGFTSLIPNKNSRIPLIKKSSRRSHKICYNCPHCPQKFFEKTAFKTHVLTHKPRKPKGELHLSCPICKEKFEEIFQLSVHCRRMHLSRTDFKCCDCNLSFKNLPILTIHYHALHSSSNIPLRYLESLEQIALSGRRWNTSDQRRGYRCELCHEDFATSILYKKHKTNHKNEIRLSNLPYTCSLCGDKFEAMYLLLKHLRNLTLHTDKKEFNCLVCNDHFENVENLTVHHHREHSTISENMFNILSSLLHKGYGSSTLRKNNNQTQRPASDTRVSQRLNNYNSIAPHPKRGNATSLYPKGYHCDMCTEGYNDYRVLVDHKIQHLIDSSQSPPLLFKCPACTVECDTVWKFLVHLNDHDGSTLRTCPRCDNSFENLNLLVVHHYKSHFEAPELPSNFVQNIILDSLGLGSDPQNQKLKPIICSRCNIEFVYRNEIKRHWSLKHGKLKYCCEKCGMQFKMPSTLKKHAQTHLEKHERRLIDCKECGEKFVSKFTLKTHYIALHTKEKPYKCVVCSKEFGLASALHIHKVTVCEKDKAIKRTCPTCGRSFDNYIELSYHKHNFHKYGNTEDTKCHLCSKVFKKPVNLYQHNKQYHKSDQQGEVLLCPVCGTSRKNMIFMFNHWLIHRDEQLFECIPCQAKFKQACGYYQHRKIKHGRKSNLKFKVDAKLRREMRLQFSKLMKKALSPIHYVSQANKSTTLNVPNCQRDNGPTNNDTGSFVASTNIVDDLSSGNKDELTATVGSHGQTLPVLAYIDFSKANVPVDSINRELPLDSPTECENEVLSSAVSICDSVISIRKKRKNSDVEKEHDVTHSGIRPHCPHCDKSFVGSRVLKRHISIIHWKLSGFETKPIRRPEKSFACSKCSRRFRNRGALENHLELHDSNRPYGCSLCSRRYNSNSNLVQHRRKVHKELKGGIIITASYSISEKTALLPDGYSNESQARIYDDVTAVDWRNTDDKINPSFDSKFSGDPFRRKLIVELEKLKEYECESGNAPLYSSKQYESHMKTKLHEKQIENQKDYVHEANCPTKIDDANSFVDSINAVDNTKDLLISTVGGERHVQTLPVLENVDFSKVLKENVPEKSLERGVLPDVLTKCENGPISSISISSSAENNKGRNNIAVYNSISKKTLMPDENSDQSDPDVGIYDDVPPADWSDIEDTINPLLDSKKSIFSDPYPYKLIVELEKLKEYKCKNCNVTFYSLEPYKKHMKTRRHLLQVKNSKDSLANKKEALTAIKAAKIKSYICNICGKINTVFKDHKLHLKQHKDLKYKYKCVVCKTIFDTQNSLESHYSVIHKNEMPFKCEQCSEEFATKFRFQMHRKNSHSIVDDDFIVKSADGNYFCSQCNKTFIGLDKFMSHSLRHDKGLERHIQCDTCEMTFLREDSYKAHLRVHTGENPYSCDKCEDIAFHCSRKLREHVNKVHLGNACVCDFCGKSFGGKKSLIIHLRIHTGEKPFSCDQCEKSYTAQQYLKEHISQAHLKIRHVCEICGNSFNDMRNLRTHTLIHSGIRHQCPHCDRKFVRPIELKKHVTFAHGVLSGVATKSNKPRPLACSKCPERFNNQGALDKHSELHDPNRPFECSLCTCRFNFSSNLVLHRKNVHEKQGINYWSKSKAKAKNRKISKQTN